MPVFALYNFDDADTHAADSALSNGAQDGLYLNGAAASGGQAVLDGTDDLVKIYPNPAFQMDRGTLDINFTLGADPLTDTQTLLSRDSAGTTDGGYRIEILPNGSVVISHETPAGVETFGTPAGFANPGDSISLSYSWDQGGAGGVLNINNATTGGVFSDTVPNTLTMDMSGQGINQPWIIGAGQANSDPNILNNIDQHFQGTVSMFQLSDTVDNVGGRDGIVRGSLGNDVIDNSYVDPTDGDRVDANDALIPGDGPNDDRIEAAGGNDTAIGGIGNDTVNGDAGNDSLLGDGPGVADSYDRAYPGDYTADVNPDNNRDLLTGGAGQDWLEGGDDADTLYGGGGVDVVIGGIDDDLIYGGAAPGETGSFDGSDSLIGGQGRDTIFGGVGDDRMQGDDGNPGTHNAPDDGSDLDTENNRDLLNGGEGDDLILGGDDDDTLNGDAGNDDLRGGLDDDLVNGGAGNDGLMGETGNDVLNGDAGNDTLYGGAGNDSMTGGADRDLFVGGNAGDVVDGSETGDDNDTLDLRGLGPLTIVYDPTNAENGTVTFRDAAGNPTGTMSFVNIENVLTDPSDGPDANPDTATTDEDAPVTISVLANDTDPTGQPLTVTTATAPNGTVTINPNGTVTYTPNPDFNGTDTITYTVTDPDGNTDTSTVTVTVNPVNDAPVANDDASTTPFDTPITFAVMGNDTDVDGDTLTISGVPTSPNGTVTVNPNGTLTFTPNPGFTGAAVVNYTIVDEEGLTDSAVWTITVAEDGNLPPVAEDDTAETVIDTPVTIAILANDSDPDGDTLFIIGTPTSPDGTVVVNPDGTITFTPEPGFTGEATINYLISDGNGGTDPAVVTVTVTDPTGPDGIVRGTTGGDLIDGTYVDPFDTDSVDDNDAILPGDAPNDDRILAGAGNDTVLAGLGDDSVEAGTGNDSVRGGVGDDTVFGQDGDDTILGEDGNDSLTGGHGNDSVNGGNGDDVIDTRGDTTPLPDQNYPGIYGADDNPDDDHDTVNGGEGNDTILTGDDDDTITGGFGNDVIDAGFDDDLVEGNQGDDTITGAEGNDTIDAGQGDDVVYGGYGPGVPDAVNIPDSIDARPNNGRDSIVGGAGNDTIYGMDDDDTIAGGLDNDVIYGGIDDDSIGGESGNDRLFGDEGNDTVNGGLGNDTLTGGAGTDLLSGDADRDDFLVVSPSQGAGDTVYGGSGGDDFDRLILTGAAPYRLRDVVEDSDGNGIDGTVEFLDADGNVTGSLTFTNIEEIVPCFTPGTLIATPKGEVPVEHLKAGDRVITRDNGIQEIRWTGQKALGWHDLAANPHLKPVLIRQGSLGNGLPERDMMVSPNHRMLVANDRTALYFDEHEVLVSAKHLVASQGIQSVDSVGTTYIHFMFDRHEVVLGNGAWTESFQPGDMTLKGMGNAQRTEIFELFPELKTDAGLNDYQAARRTLKKHEALLLVK